MLLALDFSGGLHPTSPIGLRRGLHPTSLFELRRAKLARVASRRGQWHRKSAHAAFRTLGENSFHSEVASCFALRASKDKSRQSGQAAAAPARYHTQGISWIQSVVLLGRAAGKNIPAARANS
jgi:hypothetical protein